MLVPVFHHAAFFFFRPELISRLYAYRLVIALGRLLAILALESSSVGGLEGAVDGIGSGHDDEATDETGTDVDFHDVLFFLADGDTDR